MQLEWITLPPGSHIKLFINLCYPYLVLFHQRQLLESWAIAAPNSQVCTTMLKGEQAFPVETLLWPLISPEIKSEPARVPVIQPPSPTSSASALRAGTRGGQNLHNFSPTAGSTEMASLAHVLSALCLWVCRPGWSGEASPGPCRSGEPLPSPSRRQRLWASSGWDSLESHEM